MVNGELPEDTIGFGNDILYLKNNTTVYQYFAGYKNGDIQKS